MVRIGMFLGDRYEILEKIGSGGMAEVFKGKDHKLNRFVDVYKRQALLNGGDCLEPQLLLGAEKKVQNEQVFSPEEAEQLLTEMYQNVEEPDGSAHEAQRKDWRMAGLTGSASMSGGKDLGWFVGLSAEDTDRPLLLTVMIEDVKERGGSTYVISRGMKGFDVYRNEDGQ